MDSWLTENFKEMCLICKKISKLEDYDDLCQMCIEQFISNKKAMDIPDEQKLFFFARIVRNNFNSKTSKYHNLYRKARFEEVLNLEISDEEYIESPISLEWINLQISNLKRSEWYYGRLIELYIEEGCSLTKLSKRTTIPINSISRDISKVKKILRDRRDKELADN